MEYVIRNNRGVYVKLDRSGRPVTCAEYQRESYDEHKAKNICDNLPKVMKRLNFTVNPVQEQVQEDQVKQTEEKSTPEYIESSDFTLSEDITRWVDKFGLCDDVIEEAKQRESELIKQLDACDMQLLDILHIIEIGKPLDMFGGWKMYKRVYENRKHRRKVKDELLIIGNVLQNTSGTTWLKRASVQKAIDGLFNRKYSFRIVEDGMENEAM